ncbi:hypothetical protein WR25_07427 [Diploscapter pachys]|uniref:Uncharacterized protein n=1 Tax=Diploscapter pachys TaxID=2018661 RepID=A0A2A2KXZ4_9BILA|nr:hypothetical protein WR25_07427 [Diploscapter pachys]
MMAGLFPPKNGQIWNPQLLWQPIAMHTDETLDQVSTGISGPCPVYTETVWNDRRYKDIEKYIDPLVVQLLRNRTGEYLRDGHWLNKAIDSVKSRYYINDSRYEVPDWAAPHIDKFIKSSLNFHTEMLNIQNDTVGAFHLELIMSNVEEHLECRRDPEFQKKMIKGNNCLFVFHAHFLRKE